jgi:hypothetical protein
MATLKADVRALGLSAALETHEDASRHREHEGLIK